MPQCLASVDVQYYLYIKSSKVYIIYAIVTIYLVIPFNHYNNFEGKSFFFLFFFLVMKERVFYILYREETEGQRSLLTC